MKTKEEIVNNLLSRYTGKAVDTFEKKIEGKYKYIKF